MQRVACCHGILSDYLGVWWEILVVLRLSVVLFPIFSLKFVLHRFSSVILSAFFPLSSKSGATALDEEYVSTYFWVVYQWFFVSGVAQLLAFEPFHVLFIFNVEFCDNSVHVVTLVRITDILLIVTLSFSPSMILFGVRSLWTMPFSL